MTKFEQIGVNYQYQATNIEEAIKSFEYSCQVCTHKLRCMYNECKHCAIQQVHNQVVAILNEMKGENKNE